MDNVKSWQVFEYDKKIHQFYTLAGDFEGAPIDEENEFQEEFSLTQEPLQKQTMDLKEAIREEESIIVDDTKENDEERVLGFKLQESEVQQGYENNICGK